MIHSKENKQKLFNIIGTFSVAENINRDTESDSDFDHDEEDITMISYVLKEASSGKKVLSDDIDVFVLHVLIYWIYCEKVQSAVQQMGWHCP